MKKSIKHFLSNAQKKAIVSLLNGEEKDFFWEKMSELCRLVETMPKSYETDGQGWKAVAFLHYFKGGMDFYITERDMGDEKDGENGLIPGAQYQAFGLADHGHGAELGYISIQELIENGVELDLYWTPKTLDEIRGIA